MNWKLAIVAVAAVTLLASPVRAGVRGKKANKAQKRARIMAKFDVNKNGVLDPQEKQALQAARKARKAQKRARIMAKFDVDKNGVLDPQEKQALKATRKARKVKRLARWLKKRDANLDGVLTWDEVAPDRPDRVQRARQRFQRLDANGDGVIDKAELARAAKKLGEKRRRAHRGLRAPGATPPAPPAQ